jgi:hypothetical protein
MSGISDSAKFNNNSSYYFPSDANTAAGVLSLNGLAGVLSVASSDSSVAVTPAGSLINVSTTGQAQAPSTVTATGAISTTSTVTAGAAPATGSQFKTNASGTISLVSGTGPLTFLNAFIGTATPHLVMWWIQGAAGVSDTSYMGGLTLFRGNGYTTNPNGLPVFIDQNQANSFTYTANGSVNPVIMQYTNSGPAQTAILNYTVIF